MELLPCPFCGMSPISDGLDDMFDVRCSNCGSSTEVMHTESEASDAWNTRTPAIDVADIRESLFEIRRLIRYAPMSAMTRDSATSQCDKLAKAIGD